MKRKISLSIATAVLLSTNIYASEDLGMITVTSATKSEQSIKDVTSNVEVITGAELEEKHITTVIDALKLTNISINQSGGIGQTSSFFLGGMSAEHTLVLVDGVRYNDPTVTNGYALLDHLMISDIERIEIIKGAQSGIWGADAAAGVINIITKKPNEKQTLMLNLEAGSFNTKKTNMKIQAKDEKNNFGMSVSQIKSDGFSAMVPKGKDVADYEDDKYENTTVKLQYGFNINDTNKIDFAHTIVDAKGDYDSDFASGIKANDTTSNFTNKNKFTQINFNHIDSFNTFDIYTNKSTFDRTYAGGEYIGETKEIGIKSKIPYATKDFIIIGADSKEQIMNKSYSVLEGKYKSKGIFATNSNNFSNTIVTESLRKDNYDSFQDKTTGKIGIKQIFTDDLSIKANYGTAYKTPSLYNLYAGFGAGNLNLKPEDIKSLDASIEYKDFVVKYFSSTIENEILYLYSPTTPDYYQSDKKSKYKGYEIAYQKGFEATLLSLKYINQSAKDGDGNDLQRREKEKVNFSADYFGIKAFNFNLNGAYIGERYDDLAKTKQTGKYIVLNTVVNYEYKRNLNLYLKINNIADKNYQEVDGYATSPRAYYVGVNATF
ncbi:MAG: TonB-dependent receptor plug domain-containing protein [Arcobacteraceae bacterium]